MTMRFFVLFQPGSNSARLSEAVMFRSAADLGEASSWRQSFLWERQRPRGMS